MKSKWLEVQNYGLASLNVALTALVCTWIGSAILLVAVMSIIIIWMIVYCKLWAMIHICKQVFQQKQRLVLSFYQLSLVVIPSILVLILSSFGAYLTLRYGSFSWQYFCGSFIITFESLVLVLICREMQISGGDLMKFLNH